MQQRDSRNPQEEYRKRIRRVDRTEDYSSYQSSYNSSSNDDSDRDWSRKGKLATSFQRNWSLDQFYSYRIRDKKGNYVWWIDIYFQHIYPNYPLLPGYILRSKLSKAPKPFAHSLVACCANYSTEPPETFRSHFHDCTDELDDALAKPDYFTVMAIVHMAIYYIEKCEINNAIKYVGMLVRLTSFMGLYSKLSEQKLLVSDVLDEQAAKQVVLAVTQFVYTYDYYCSVITGFPFMVGPGYLNTLLLNSFDSKVVTLVEFARHVSRTIMYPELLDSKKEEWGRIDKKLLDPSDVEPVLIAYLKLFHYYIYFLLIRRDVPEDLDDPFVLQLLQDSCKCISTIVTLDFKLEIVPIFFGQLVFTIGLFCSLRKNEMNGNIFTDQLFDRLFHSKIPFSQDKVDQLLECNVHSHKTWDYIQNVTPRL